MTRKAFSPWWTEVNAVLKRMGAVPAERGEAEGCYEHLRSAEDAAKVIVDQRRHNAAEEDRAEEVYWEGGT
jgi:hypothetical protein